MKSKVAIVAVFHPDAIGGQKKSALELVEGLKGKIDFELVSLPRPNQYNSLFRFLYSFILLCKLLKLRIFNGIRIIHFYIPCYRFALAEKLFLAFVLKLTSARTLLNFRGSFDSFYLKLSKAERKMVSVLIRTGSGILCQHTGIKNFLVSYGIAEADKIFVIPNTVQLPFSQNVSKQPHGNEFRLLYLGWLITHKRIELLIDSFKPLVKELSGYNIKLDLIGPEMEKGYSEKLTGIINAHQLSKHIEILRPGDADKNVFSEYDRMVLPSDREGFPNVLIEAMANHVPVIAADVMPMNEILENGECGFLFEPGNASSLTAILREAIQDTALANRKAEKAFVKISEEFVFSRVEEKYLILYKRLSSEWI